MGVQSTLYQLYLTDQQVRGLERRVDAARSRAGAQQQKLDELREQRQQLENQLSETRAHEQTLEGETEDIDQRVETLRKQMNDASSNKEYKAFLVEINTLKADKSKKEDRALELMNEIEKLQGRIQQLDEQIAEQEKIKSVADQELADRQQEVGAELEQLKQQREQHAQQVPQQARAIFERLADTMEEGEAMAPVEQEDARRMEYTCGGCFMSIPMETVNKLISEDEVTQCTSCSRILYLGEDVKEAMGMRS